MGTNRKSYKTLHKFGLIMSTLVLFYGIFFGVIEDNVKQYFWVYTVRASGLYILFYCAVCFLAGEENVISSGWNWLDPKKFTRENNPYQFIYLLSILFILAVSFIYISLKVDI